MNIFVVRHGESEENIKGTFYGSIDCNLSEKGKLQCLFVKEKLESIHFDKIFYSPTIRAKETLEIIYTSKNTHKVCDKRLGEINFGQFEGKSYNELLMTYNKECKLWEKDWINFTPPEGESYLDLFKRIEEFMEELLKDTSENVLIVSHGGPIRAIYSYVMNKNLETFWKFGCNNCDIAKIRYEYGNLFIESIYHYDSLLK